MIEYIFSILDEPTFMVRGVQELVTDMTDGLPIAVDLDGTTILTDMSWVTLKRVVLLRPWLIPGCLWLELTGKRAKWKRWLGSRLKFEPSELKYHEEFLGWLKGQHAEGRTLILCTASEKTVAKKIADHLGIFSDVMASEGVVNLAGGNKCSALVERFGEMGFAYCGNSRDDLKVWSSAGEVIVVNPSRGVLSGLGEREYTLFK